MNMDFSWNKLLHGTSDGVLRFMLSSATNTLPTPDNLRRWGVPPEMGHAHYAILFELTVPIEDRISTSRVIKTKR